MSASVEELLKRVEVGDVEACVAWFAGMPEAERRAHAPQLLQVARDIEKNAWVQTGNSFQLSAASKCAPVLRISTGSISELKRLPSHSLPRGDLAYRLLVDRSPTWLNEWAAHLLSQERYWLAWTLVRRLLREGRIQRPTSPNYVLSMISGMPTPVIDELRADPDLLDHEIWQLFEQEGAGENSLANVDRWGRDGWGDALMHLSAEGRLDRQRLLDSCLSALQRDFNHYRARWFTTFFDRLEPSAEELRARAELLLGLLRLSVPPVVSWAYTKVARLARSGAYESSTLVVALEPVMGARAKGIVKKALKLLNRLAKSTAVHAQVARCAVQALGHEAQDVQQLALDLVETVADRSNAELVAQLEAYRALVAPSLQPQLDAWLGVEAEARAPIELPDVSELSASLRHLYAVDDVLQQPSEAGWTLPAARFDGTDLPRLTGPATPPVADLSELLDLIAQGLEGSLNPLDLERTLDGIARLGTERPADFERSVGPIAKRAKKVLERDAPFLGGDPSADLAGVVTAWLTGSPPTTHIEKREHYDRAVVVVDGEEYSRGAVQNTSITDFMNRRVLRLAQQVGSGIAQPLLALPTHEGGFLDPRVLVGKVSAGSCEAPHTSEVVLAMLRLAPERRDEALAGLPSAGPEWLHALRYALGGTEKLGSNAALWICASRARAPWHDHPAVLKLFPSGGPDAGEAAIYGSIEAHERHGLYLTGPEPAAVESIHSDCLPQLLHADRRGPTWGSGSVGSGTEGSIRWMATLWPQARESLFAGAALALGTNIDWWGAEWQHKALLEPLLDPRTPLRDMGLLLLAIGLGAKEPGEHLLATDAAITAIEDGRLGSDNLGRVLSELLPKSFVKLGRYAKTLAAVADASNAHAAVVFLALDHALPTVMQHPPRDYGKLLELTEQLGVRLNARVSEDCRQALASFKGSAKAKKTAARIGARSAEWSTEMQAATAELAGLRAGAALAVGAAL